MRDCTLAILEDESKYVIIMSTAGHIYFQCLNQESSAANGTINFVQHFGVKSNSSFVFKQDPSM